MGKDGRNVQEAVRRVRRGSGSGESSPKEVIDSKRKRGNEKVNVTNASSP